VPFVIFVVNSPRFSHPTRHNSAMRKRIHIVLVLLLVVVVGGFAWVVRAPREPQYRGIRLSDWLNNPPAAARDGTMEQAVRKIGTNGIPFYLDWIGTKESPLRDKAIDLLRKQSPITFRCYKTAERRQLGRYGIVFLGPAAAPAVPALMRMLADTNNPDAQASASFALGVIGPAAEAAVPALIQRFNDATGQSAEQTAFLLGKIHARPDLTLPAMVHYLKVSTNEPGHLYYALNALAEFGPEAKATIPAIVPCLRSPAPGVRVAAKDALRKIDPTAELTFPVMAQNLKVLTNQPTQLAQTLISLEEFGPEAKAAVPAIMQCLRSPFLEVRVFATNALLKIDPAAAAQAGVK
jgi:hypothetical protein